MLDQPKVRFRKTRRAAGHQRPTPLPPDSENEQADSCCEKMSHASENKIKIKSIVPVNFPLKVLKNGRHVLAQDDTSGTQSDQSHQLQFQSSPDNSSDSLVSPRGKISRTVQSPGACSIQPEPYLSLTLESGVSSDGLLTHQHTSMDEELIKRCTDGLRRLTVDSRLSLASKSGSHNENDSKNTNSVIKQNKILNYNHIDNKDNYNFANDDDDIQIVKIISNPKKSSLGMEKQSKELSAHHRKVTNMKKSISSEKLNKPVRVENKENHSKKVPNKMANKCLSAGIPSILKDSTNASSINSKHEKKTKNIGNVKTSRVMPCAKFKMQSASKNKEIKQVPSTRVEKKSLFNVVAGKTDVSVQSGSSLTKCQNKTDDLLKIEERSSTISKVLLARPEYNSTVYVIKKLKEIKNEKIITDFEKLPPAYKNLINNKVSAALEFLPCESVYKDLINLSGDEIDKFAVPPMRSKDPEPRNKDITPKLTDFYKPTFTGQYFVIANPVVREPQNVENFNPFKISKKISMWKTLLDKNF